MTWLDGDDDDDDDDDDNDDDDSLEMGRKNIQNLSARKEFTEISDSTGLINTFIQFCILGSVQFSSILFSPNIIQYRGTYTNCKLAGEHRRNQKACEDWAAQSQRNK